MFLKFSKSLLLFLSVTLLSSCMNVVNFGGFGSSKLKEVTVQEGEGSRKILLVDLIGEISLNSENSFFTKKHNAVQRVVTRLDLAREDPQVAAVVLRISSPGGGVTASEMLYEEIKRFRETSKKPIYAYVVDMAASGGYYAAMGCHKIYAPSSALVGSIGVVNFQPELAELSHKVGVHVQVTKSGRNKDMTSPFRKMTKEEKKIKQEMVDLLAERFLQTVVKERQVTDPKKQKLIGTARVFLASQGKSLGLVDEVLSFDELVEKIKQKHISYLKSTPRLVSYKGNGSMKKGLYNFMSQDSSFDLSKTNLNPLPKAFMRKGFYYLAD